MEITKSVADEMIYLFTERFGEERSKRYLDLIKDQENQLLIVAEVDSKVIGSLNIRRFSPDSNKSDHVGSLGMLVVNGYREMGVGSALMDYAMNWANETPGIEKILLGVFSGNERAIRLYEKFGFEVEGVEKKQFKIRGRYVDEILMAKFIK